MLSYLHILIRVEEDGSLHALGAFSSKDKLQEYQNDTGLKDGNVRLDFFNGPFPEGIKVIYAGHRRWNMDRFQLAGYFKSEGEAWNCVTHDGYVSVLQIDTTYEEELQLQQKALERYAQLQKRWRLTTYDELIAREGLDKTRANIVLRFYEDALDSFKPKSRRDIRALYALFAVILTLPIAVFFFLSHQPEFGEHLDSVSWLPGTASNISFYKSKQVEVYEFNISENAFKIWARDKGLKVTAITNQQSLSRYKAYIPSAASESGKAVSPDGSVELEQFEAWQNAISAEVEQGWHAHSKTEGTAIFDSQQQRAYYEQLINF